MGASTAGGDSRQVEEEGGIWEGTAVGGRQQPVGEGHSDTLAVVCMLVVVGIVPQEDGEEGVGRRGTVGPQRTLDQLEVLVPEVALVVECTGDRGQPEGGRELVAGCRGVGQGAWQWEEPVALETWNRWGQGTSGRKWGHHESSPELTASSCKNQHTLAQNQHTLVQNQHTLAQSHFHPVQTKAEITI